MELLNGVATAAAAEDNNNGHDDVMFGRTADRNNLFGVRERD